ncbi:hypothetical protein [Aquimarina sp. 2201CG14-23]|nr:hypothetical protein [Aquimarina sp. 2201CG14-23]MDH7445833.1 hypothetical protein [Aquimarina sp. 2201CG14-23]
MKVIKFKKNKKRITLIINTERIRKFFISLPKASSGAIHGNNGSSY